MMFYSKSFVWYDLGSRIVFMGISKVKFVCFIIWILGMF